MEILIDVTVGAVAAGAAGLGAYGAIQGGRANRQMAKYAASADRRGSEQRHDELAPQVEPETVTLQRQGDAWFATVSVNRRYAVAGFALSGGVEVQPGVSQRRLDLPLGLVPKVAERFEVEKYRESGPAARVLWFKFWPSETWSCGCGRPEKPSSNGPAHWECWVPVEVRPEPFFMFGR